LSVLDRSAKTLGSGALALLADDLRQAPPTDHFVKVRSLIKDLISKLEQEGVDEATAKTLCDTQMSEAVTKRDERQTEIEGLKAKIQGTTSTIAKNKADMADLKAEIADLQKSLQELTALRQEEKAQNEKSIADAKSGADAIKQALVVLQDYYGTAMFQAGSAYVPPNADREGQTVSDLAPETFSGDYEGKAAESKGVIGMLEVIQSDFERTATTTEAYETEAQTNFDAESGRIEQSVQVKDQKFSEIEGATQTAESELTLAEDNLRTANKLHEDALETLEKLQSSCVDASESYAERRQRREQEIEALKQAMQILEDWKGF